MSPKQTFLSLSILLASTSAAHGDDVIFTPGGLTSDQVVARAEATSPDLVAKARERAAAQAAVDQALAAYLPRVSGVARYTRLSPIDVPTLGNLVVAPGLPAGPVPAGTPTGALIVAPVTFPVVLNQSIAQATAQVPLSDYILRIPAAHAAATRNARAAALTERAARLQLATDARAAYYAWVRALLQARAARQALTQAQAHLADARQATTAGTASKADLLRVESQVAATEQLNARARSLVIMSEQNLRVLMHDSGRAPLLVGEDVESGEVPTPGSGANVRTLWGEALDKRLEPRALRESAGALRDQARVARAAGLPRLDAIGNATWANPNPRVFPQRDSWTGTWDAGVQVSWAPTDVFGTEAARKQALARAEAIDAQRAALEDAIRNQVTQAVALREEAVSAVSTSARGLAAAEESYRVRRLLFQNGRATSVEQTDAETELDRARIAAIDARIDLRVGEVRLAHALGRDVSEPR